jgi:hypothetical protein
MGFRGATHSQRNEGKTEEKIRERVKRFHKSPLAVFFIKIAAIRQIKEIIQKKQLPNLISFVTAFYAFSENESTEGRRRKG